MNRTKVNASVLYISVLLSLVLLLPFLFLFIKGISGIPKEWHHITQNLLSEYIWNTLKILLSVSVLTILWGIVPAYLVSKYAFPGSRMFSWTLVGPLAIPTFIMAIVYSGITDVTGPLARFVNWFNTGGDPFYLDILNYWGLSLTLSFALYPYVYLSSLIAFRSSSDQFEETAKNLGYRPLVVFLKVSLRMAIPFIITGVLLVMMELLNDYGAMKYYGYNTLTTGIFKAWFDLNDLTSSIYMSGVLFLFVLVLLYLRYKNNVPSTDKLKGVTKRTQLLGWKKWLAMLLCSLILLFAFIIPSAYIVGNGIQYFGKVADASLARIVFSSIGIAAVSSAIVLILAILFAESKRMHNIKWLRWLFELNNVGYAIPGAIIAIGVIALLHIFKIHSGAIVLSFVFLIFAFVVRFFSSGYQSTDNALRSKSIHQDEAALTMGQNYGQIFKKIHLPQLKGPMLVAFLFVFIEVIKELPLTLILKPFNFESLATETFQLAKDEMLNYSCVPAMFIIVITMAPNFLIHKFLQQGQ